MVKVYFYIFLILTIGNGSVLANKETEVKPSPEQLKAEIPVGELIYLIVDEPKIDGISDELKSEIKRTLMHEALKLEGYQLLLKENSDVDVSDIKHRIIRVSATPMDWGAGKKGYKITLSFHDSARRFDLLSRSKERVEIKSLVYQIRLLFHELFKENKITLNNSSILKPTEFFDKKDHERIVHIEDEKKFQHKSDEEKIKKMEIARLKLQREVKGESVFFDVPIEEIIAQSDEGKKEKDKKSIEAKDEKLNNLVLNKVAVQLGETKKSKKVFSIGAGMTNMALSSQDKIEVETTIGFITFNGNAQFYLESRTIEYFEASIKLGKSLQASQYGLGPSSSLMGRYLFQPSGWSFTTGGGFRYQTLPFINLPTYGAGLEGSDITMLWLVGSIGFEKDILGLNCYFSGSVLSGFVGNTTYDGGGNGLNGTGIEFAVETNVWKKFMLLAEVGYNQIDATGSKSFKNTVTYMHYSGKYRF